MIISFPRKLKKKQACNIRRRERPIYAKELILLAVFMVCLISTNAKCIDRELQDRVTNYYNLEKERDWDKTYPYRTPLYRKSINFKLYKRKMDENIKGWKLIEFNILKIIVKKNYAALKIAFVEKVPQGYFPNNVYNAIKITQISTWEKIDNIWYIRDACSRTHLTLNGDLAMEDNQEPIAIFVNFISTDSGQKLKPIKINLGQPEQP